MPIKFRRFSSVAAVALALSASAHAAASLLSADQQQVVAAVSTVFTAARTDDVKMFDAVITPDFYIYDGGARFNGDAIMGLIKSMHAAGKRFEWKVTESDVHIDGDMAWIAYVNQGSVSDASGTTKQTWLESAVLRKQASAWKIAFLHSTRVPAPSSGAHGK